MSVRIPHTAPPFWPESRPGRLASGVYRNSTELLDDPHPERYLSKCSVALLGLADDTGVAMNHGRPGAREGPHAFRAALARYGAATPMDAAASYPHVFDAGDIIAGEDIHETHDRVTEAVDAVLNLGLFPVGIGGGHDLTYPFVRAVATRYSPISGIYLDAHLDVRGEAGSGMAFRSLVEECEVRRLRCIGADRHANSGEHYHWFRRHNGNLDSFTPDLWPDEEHQFVSIDLDVLDSAYAPGVSAPNPCGMTPAEVAAYAFGAGRCPNVRCFDIMELNPGHDHDGRTARLAAHVFLEFLRGFSLRPSAPSESE